MTIEHKNLDDINEQDLQELVDSKRPESLTIEYKQELYRNDDEGKKELLKDVTAFANHNGGHIFLGIVEAKGIASKVIGISDINPDAEERKIDSIIKSGTEPDLYSVHTVSVPINSKGEDKKYVIVIRIPRSWGAPHRVSRDKINRIWVRNSSGAHEASMDELRSLFTKSSDVNEKIQYFHKKRISQIMGGDEFYQLENNGRIILHLVPYTSFLSNDFINVEEAYRLQHKFQPLLSETGYTTTYNYDGIRIEKGGGPTTGYTQVYRSGIIEATLANILREHNKIYTIGSGIEKKIIEKLPLYFEGMQELGIVPPITFLLTLEGVRGARYYIADPVSGEFGMPFENDILYLTECYIDEFNEDHRYDKKIRAAFDNLWNAAGQSRDKLFDNDDNFIG